MQDFSDSKPKGAHRPRLLVLTSTYPRWAGDPEPGFVHELSRRLTDKFQVTVLCPHACGALPKEQLDGVKVIRYRYAPERWERLVNNGGIVTNLKRHPWMFFLLPGFILGQLFWLYKLGHRRNTDVIHAHWLIPQGFLVALLMTLGRKMAPFVVTSHGADLFALRGKLLTKIKQFTLARSAAATVVSNAMKTMIAAMGIPQEKIAVESMGIDLQNRFYPDPVIQRNPDELLFVGRLVEKKGLRYLIEALPHILQQRPNVRLTIAGFGPELSLCKQQVEKLNLSAHVDFIGAVPQADLPSLYRRAAVFVAPFIQAASGDQEGLGLVVLEALGCGCPAVISDLPATREFGEIRGLCRTPPANIEMLAQTILDQLQNPATPGRSALMRFDWQHRADCYSDILLKSANKCSSSNMGI